MHKGAQIIRTHRIGRAGCPLVQRDVVNFQRAGRIGQEAAELVDLPVEVGNSRPSRREISWGQRCIGICTRIISVKGAGTDDINVRAVSNRYSPSQSRRQRRNRCPGGPIKFIGIGNRVAGCLAAEAVEIFTEAGDSLATNRERIVGSRAPGAGARGRRSWRREVAEGVKGCHRRRWDRGSSAVWAWESGRHRSHPEPELESERSSVPRF